MTTYNTTCVVCGRYSNRTSWNNSIIVGGNTYVACDFHTQDEFTYSANQAYNSSIPPAPEVVEQDTAIDESAES